MNNKTRNGIFIALIVLIILCLAVTVWALFFRDTTPAVTPDYPPQGIEPNQSVMQEDNTSKLDAPEGGGAINVTFSTSATASLSADTVALYYANPAASNQNVAITLMIDELVVAKSELITPGHEIRELKLEDEAKSALKAGGYDAELVVRAFNDDGEKAMVDTKGEITLTVSE